jgi:hypothetical protein
LRLLSADEAVKNAFKNKDLQRTVKDSGEESASFAGRPRAETPFLLAAYYVTPRANIFTRS